MENKNNQQKGKQQSHQPSHGGMYNDKQHRNNEHRFGAERDNRDNLGSRPGQGKDQGRPGQGQSTQSPRR